MEDDDGIRVDVSHVDELIVVTVQGDIDMISSHILGAELDQIPSHAQVMLDLGGVAFIDSPGLAVVMAAWIRLDQSRGSLRIRAASLPVHRVLEIAGLVDLIDGDGMT